MEKLEKVAMETKLPKDLSKIKAIAFKEYSGTEFCEGGQPMEQNNYECLTSTCHCATY